MENRKGFIYGLICPESNNIRYIGQTIQGLSRRLRKHINENKKKSSNKEHLNHKDAWIRGLIIREKISEIKIEIIEEVDSYLLDEREVYWIQYYKDQGLDLTNSTTGGKSTRVTARKAYVKTRVNNNQYTLGGKCSEETKKKLSIANSGKNHPLYGTERSEETKKKIGDANRGENNGMYGKRV